MYYRVNIDGKRKFLDEAGYADLKASGIKYELETTNRWLSGVVNEFDDTWCDGEILDEVISLIDNGECNA